MSENVERHETRTPKDTLVMMGAGIRAEYALIGKKRPTPIDKMWLKRSDK